MQRLRTLDPALRLSTLNAWPPIHCPQDPARFADGLRLAGLAAWRRYCAQLVHAAARLVFAGLRGKKTTPRRKGGDQRGRAG
ncbi:hypothetical protein [Mycoplana sp. MJR14]|uniref:hypothetical protein n=1 Tax=Mycoplana sp. MJR14 TaxID=3032583 RepID=UPI0023DA924B|nr:hypothetical protein [Mycoplana sp. MJR14]MDF1635275.1 hypothetical protein [Mycoplana sp. MJR14]